MNLVVYYESKLAYYEKEKLYYEKKYTDISVMIMRNKSFIM